MLENARFSYMPTFTGPGHASVYTGTTPAVHGIMGNDWYVRELGTTTYVTDDASVATVGSESSAGEMSPRQLLTTTVGDELRLRTNGKSRVIAVSLKDRGAILPAGHTGQAYWLDYASGRFITSSYYRDELPDWLTRFNDRNLVDTYLARQWETLLSPEEYTASAPGGGAHGLPLGELLEAGFPYDLSALAEHQGPGLVAYTPYGDELLLELVLATIEGEALGQRSTPDVLAISFSSPDHVGHRFGPMSIEVQDTFLRLDRQIARLLTYLDEHIGRERVLLFLTSDHGVAHIPSWLEKRSIPAGQFRERNVEQAIRRQVRHTYGRDFVEAFHNQQVFLDHDRLRARGVALREIQEDIALFLLRQDGIAGALPAHALMLGEISEGIRGRVQRGYNSRRSGDVVAWLAPHWIPEDDKVSTTHGSAYGYDARVPLVWHGWGVEAGRSATPVRISDIAPTLAMILGVALPSGATGEPMLELMRRASR